MQDPDLNASFVPHISLHTCFDRPYLNQSYAGPSFVYGRAILDVILSVSILLVNVILIVAIFFYRRSNRGTTRVYNSGASMKFVLMLAISDVCVGLSGPVYLLPHYFCDINDWMRKNEYLCVCKYASTLFAALMSNCSLISIAIDRYIAVEYTIKYRIIMTHRACHLMMAAQLVFSTACASVLFVWNHWKPGGYCELEEIVPTSFVLALGSICHGLILVIVIGVNIKMHQKASECASRRNILELRISKETSRSIKSAKIVVLIAGLYILCWTPYSIVLMARMLAGGSNPFIEFFFQLTFPLSYSNSLFNPFIYAWKNSEIQNAVVWSFRRANRKQSNPKHVKAGLQFTSFEDRLKRKEPSEQPVIVRKKADSGRLDTPPPMNVLSFRRKPTAVGISAACLSTTLLALTLPLSVWFCVKSVAEHEKIVVFRRGHVKEVREQGTFLVLPLTDRCKTVDTRQLLYNIPAMKVITTDSGEISITGVLYYKVFDPILASVMTEDYKETVKHCTKVVLIDFIRKRTLCQAINDCLSASKDLLTKFDEATLPFGVRVLNVRLRATELSSFDEAPDTQHRESSIKRPSFRPWSTEKTVSDGDPGLTATGSLLSQILNASRPWSSVSQPNILYRSHASSSSTGSDKTAQVESDENNSEDVSEQSIDDDNIDEIELDKLSTEAVIADPVPVRSSLAGNQRRSRTSVSINLPGTSGEKSQRIVYTRSSDPPMQADKSQTYPGFGKIKTIEDLKDAPLDYSQIKAQGLNKEIPAADKNAEVKLAVEADEEYTLKTKDEVPEKKPQINTNVPTIDYSRKVKTEDPQTKSTGKVLDAEWSESHLQETNADGLNNETETNSEVNDEKRKKPQIPETVFTNNERNKVRSQGAEIKTTKNVTNDQIYEEDGRVRSADSDEKRLIINNITNNEKNKRILADKSVTELILAEQKSHEIEVDDDEEDINNLYREMDSSELHKSEPQTSPSSYEDIKREIPSAERKSVNFKIENQAFDENDLEPESPEMKLDSTSTYEGNKRDTRSTGSKSVIFMFDDEEDQQIQTIGNNTVDEKRMDNPTTSKFLRQSATRSDTSEQLSVNFRIEKQGSDENEYDNPEMKSDSRGTVSIGSKSVIFMIDGEEQQQVQQATVSDMSAETSSEFPVISKFEIPDQPPQFLKTQDQTKSPLIGISKPPEQSSLVSKLPEKSLGITKAIVQSKLPEKWPGISALPENSPGSSTEESPGTSKEFEKYPVTPEKSPALSKDSQKPKTPEQTKSPLIGISKPPEQSSLVSKLPEKSLGITKAIVQSKLPEKWPGISAIPENSPGSSTEESPGTSKEFEKYPVTPEKSPALSKDSQKSINEEIKEQSASDKDDRDSTTSDSSFEVVTDESSLKGPVIKNLRPFLKLQAAHVQCSDGNTQALKSELSNPLVEFIAISVSIIILILTLPLSIWICFKVVQEYERAVIFRLGRIRRGGARGPGIFFVLPCTDTCINVDLRTASYEVPPQEVLTKDSVTVYVDAVVCYKVKDPLKAIISISDYRSSTHFLAATSLRNILGTRCLSEILADREAIAHLMQTTLNAATDPWGVKVEIVEMKDVRIPIEMQRAMAAEAEAGREARAKVIAADGEMKASRALKEAADVLANSPAALQLRYLQTLNTISAERNSTIIFPLPMNMMTFLPRVPLKAPEQPAAPPKDSEKRSRFTNILGKWSEIATQPENPPVMPPSISEENQKCQNKVVEQQQTIPAVKAEDNEEDIEVCPCKCQENP